MSGHQIHQYFKRKTSNWNILGFLAACNPKPFDRRTECYVLCLEAIVAHEKGCRHDKAQLLFNLYKQASMMIILFEKLMEIGGVTEAPSSTVIQGSELSHEIGAG